MVLSDSTPENLPNIWPELFETNKVDEVWNNANQSLYVCGLFLIQKFATMEAWSNDFSSLFNVVLLV